MRGDNPFDNIILLQQQIMSDTAPGPRSSAAAQRKASGRTLIVSITIGVLLGAAVIGLAETTDSELPGGLQIALAYLLSILAHEGGHALAGFCCGFRLVSFGIWPLALCRSAECWGFSPYPVRCMAFVSMFPSGEENVTRRLMIMTAAGPAASAIAAVAGTLLAYTLEGWLKGVMAAVAAVSLFLLLGDALGMLLKQPLSDGLRLLKLYRKDPEADRSSAMLVLLGESFSGRHPRDWDPELVRRAAFATGGAEDFLVLSMRYNWLLVSDRI